MSRAPLAVAFALLLAACAGADPVDVASDVPYADTGNPRHRLDLYLPKEPGRRPLPVVIFLHGGGWMYGDKSAGAGALHALVRSGEYAGVSAGYRLTDEARWPAQIHDGKAAVRWVRANAARYGLDPERIGVLGPSAGGHLALLLGLGGDAPGLEGSLGPHRGESSRVAAVVNFFGVTELPALAREPDAAEATRDDGFVARLLGGPLAEQTERAREASPVTYASAGDAPVLTVHGSADRLVPYDQALRLDAALRAAGVPSYLVRVEGGGHGDFGDAASDRVAAFLAKHLLGRDVEVPTAPIESW